MPREESGAQLLARLGSRPDLSSIDPYIFGPKHSRSSTAFSHTPIPGIRRSCAPGTGQVVEIYGPEGSGKTELALHYVAQACLPRTWNDVHIGGGGAKAVVLDTDLKFSVLRLAVIMEKLIINLLQEATTRSKDVLSGDIQTDGEKCSKARETPCSEAAECNPGRWDKDSNCLFEDAWPTGGHDVSSATASISSLAEQSINLANLDSNVPVSKEEMDMDIEGNSFTKQKPISCFGEIEPAQVESKARNLKAEDVESIVQESLGRIQVVKPHSPQQLHMTLLSLEQTLTLDLQTALLLLDSSSAFFWEDQLAEKASWRMSKEGSGQAGQATTSSTRVATGVKIMADGGMGLVANVISRLVSELGVIFVTTKCPLVAGGSSSATSSKKRRWRADRGEPDAVDEQGGTSGAQEEHVEFLGRAWAHLNATRITLSDGGSGISRSDTGDPCHRRTITATCSLWPGAKLFTFVDDALRFL